MTRVISRGLLAGLLLCSLFVSPAGSQSTPLLPDADAFLLTVFLRHDQSKTLGEIQAQLEKTRFNETFPPEGVEVVDHYVMMGIGQVIVLRVPPARLRLVNRAIEQGAWNAYRTEFYPTYDLRAARAAEATIR